MYRCLRKEERGGRYELMRRSCRRRLAHSLASALRQVAKAVR